MKRIKVFCGICKAARCYSILRGIKKVSSVVACENCRHFYQKLKKNPFSLDCISPIKGSCFKNCSFMKTRCKCCWAMQILDSCPHPDNLYTSLSLWLSEECRKELRGTPLTPEEITPEARGRVILELYQNNEWIESSSSEKELSQLLVDDDEEEKEEQKMEEKSKDEDKGIADENAVTSSKDVTPGLSISDLALEADDEEVDVEEEEAMIDDPAAMDDNSVHTRNLRKNLPSNTNKLNERLKRKRKKVEYFTKAVVGRKAKGPIYGSDGKISKTKMDLCDCLQAECVGCHFPCPKCRSPKCGNECRVNRRWYYERVEVEGTKMFWVNRYVPKI